MARVDVSRYQSFSEITERLDDIVAQVRDKDVSLERSLDLFDEAIALECGRSAAQIIREDGEEAFRAVETEVTGRYAARSGLVLACGGGVVTREENRDLIRQNARVVFLDRPIAELSDDGRPMSQTKGVERLAAERMDAYRSWADVTLPCTGSPAGDAELARRLLVL